MTFNSENYIGTLFTYYDHFLSSFPLGYQALISIALLIFLGWNIYAFLKHGHWLLILILIAALPGTWPAARNLFHILTLIFKGIMYRIQH